MEEMMDVFIAIVTAAVVTAIAGMELLVDAIFSSIFPPE